MTLVQAYFLVLTLLCVISQKMDVDGPRTAPSPRLQRRNVEVFDSDGAVIAGKPFPWISLFAVLTLQSGFWQYGTQVRRVLQIHNRIHRDYDSLDNFPVCHLAQRQRGVPCPSGAQIVQPRHYILLSNSE